MDDALTKEEREALDLARRLTEDKDDGSIFAHEAALVRMVDRLVSEVERLRARNEKLETLHAFVRDSDPAYQSLSVSLALSALSEPGKGGAA